MCWKDLLAADYSEFNKKYNERDIIARKQMHDLDLELAVKKIGDIRWQ